MEGTIKRLNEKKFGFISQEGKNDVFFHISSLAEWVSWDELKESNQREWIEWTKVTFDLGKSDRGPVAINIQIA